ncbi:MAG: glutathione S-transferase family protein [Proteobacteria bacterium]|nr:glutathione S-transferase family protein [Pseudomonadota bacterium]
MPDLTLISHALCPYVQRAVISLKEKGREFERVDIDLSNKPDWFRAVSPTGKVPVLRVREAAIFESNVILEFLEDTVAPALHPADPVRRAEHRSWMEFGSATLADIAGLYSAPDETAFAAKAQALAERFARLEARVVGPFFDGADFGLVDAVFGPVFRYFDVLDRIGEFGLLSAKPEVAAWRAALTARPSVQNAVTPDYPQRLEAFFKARGAHLSRLMLDQTA